MTALLVVLAAKSLPSTRPNLAAIVKLVALVAPIKLPGTPDSMRRLTIAATTSAAGRPSAAGVDVRRRGRGVGIILEIIFDAWSLLIGGTVVDRARIVKVRTQQIELGTCS